MRNNKYEINIDKICPRYTKEDRILIINQEKNSPIVYTDFGTFNPGTKNFTI